MNLGLLVAEKNGTDTLTQTDRQDSCFISIDRLVDLCLQAAARRCAYLFFKFTFILFCISLRVGIKSVQCTGIRSGQVVVGREVSHQYLQAIGLKGVVQGRVWTLHTDGLGRQLRSRLCR